MRYRRVICFFLGAWIGVSLILALGTYENFYTVGVVLKTPPPPLKDALKLLGPENGRALLRYTAGLENVTTYQDWENLQFLLGAGVALMLFLERSTRLLSIAAAAMLLIVLFLHLKIAPDMAFLAASVEFLPAGPQGGVRQQFWNLHRMYSILDAIKCLIGLAIAIFLFTQSTTYVRRRSHRHDSGLRRAEAAPETASGGRVAGH